ncbi:Acg family FMN-binding oxidoreductase [Umezawaea sp. Da 62-37]|uniref:Acg family FMN-binding oxidoreductase n=1 Tax=Umezawaea sp. Da 62-37 TaxID=3075927 RepID=UPI0028F6DB7B|nr:nitroreductase family protein [Umezawaea sp. Da 62-37]WNV87483.1 nitroreductase family protein [Umezawaea sp. Da 62-37]
MTATTPALGLTREEVESVLTTASLAPSVHNSQPWRFLVRSDRIELHADPGRALPATDPSGRELRLSCGAALLNLRLALRGKGIRPLVSLLPGADAPGALAVVRLGSAQLPDADDLALLAAVRTRRTNRRPFVDAPVPTAHRALLARAADVERSWLHVVDDRAERAKLQQLVRRAQQDQAVDPAVLVELRAWTEQRPGDAGVAIGSAGPRPESQDEWALRDFAPGATHERPSGKDYESDPLVVVLCSFYDGPLAELLAGQAMQRVLLTATTLGLSASFLSQPIEVPHVREDLRRVLGGSLAPQTLLRLGFGSPVPATPRRPVTELLMEPDQPPSNVRTA